MFVFGETAYMPLQLVTPGTKRPPSEHDAGCSTAPPKKRNKIEGKTAQLLTPETKTPVCCSGCGLHGGFVASCAKFVANTRVGLLREVPSEPRVVADGEYLLCSCCTQAAQKKEGKKSRDEFDLNIIALKEYEASRVSDPAGTTKYRVPPNGAGLRKAEKAAKQLHTQENEAQHAASPIRAALFGCDATPRGQRSLADINLERKTVKNANIWEIMEETEAELDFQMPDPLLSHEDETVLQIPDEMLSQAKERHELEMSQVKESHTQEMSQMEERHEREIQQAADKLVENQKSNAEEMRQSKERHVTALEEMRREHNTMIQQRDDASRQGLTRANQTLDALLVEMAQVRLR